MGCQGRGETGAGAAAAVATGRGGSGGGGGVRRWTGEGVVVRERKKTENDRRVVEKQAKGKT